MKCIHETIVKDIVDMIKDFKDSDEIKTVINKKNGTSIKSITSKSEGLTMVFPVICSKNMSYESAAMISKAIERKAVAMLHMLFTAAQITDAKDGADYISRFHTNLNPGKMTVDDFMDALDGFVEENGLLEAETSEYYYYKTIQEDMKAMNVYFENTVNETSLNDYVISTIGETQIITNEFQPVNEYTDDERARFIPYIDPANRPYWLPNDDAARNFNNYVQNVNNLTQADIENDLTRLFHMDDMEAKRLAHELKERDFQHKRRQDAANYYQKERELQDKIARNDMENRKTAADIGKLNADIAINRLVPQDVKKANELTPTLMHVNFVNVNSDSKYPISTSVIVGVKAKLYAVDGKDIMDRLKVKHNSKNLLLNLIKVSTREISFFKDFIFAIDKAKVDAISQSRRGASSKLWKVLERRAVKSKLRRLLSMRNDATAITTLCLTQDEVEFLKKTEYIDVENEKIIRPIMEAYNLMGFCIADEALEICKFIFDTGDDQYEVLTYDNLEKEQRDNTKKIINLMTKMK
ncbi:hypothetical protein [uncultured Clostridium sp.]|uniref:hypothetical protein n=1 Tax=uncultured Clostridium sp. TaxID=59620 RepID=UPI00263B42C0|nr:hypothetical protein [uncultured Clostridium sp.]